MGSPYRESGPMVLCPRCAEMLDELRGGVSICPRCEGLWIEKPVIVATFHDPRWPGGNSVWWRNELECPECAADGTKTVMSARDADNVIVDHCPAHGLWLDRGELARLMRSDGDDLSVLRGQIAIATLSAEELTERRARWRDESELRRKAAEAFRAARERSASRAPSPTERPAPAPDRDAQARADRERAEVAARQAREPIVAAEDARRAEAAKHDARVAALRSECERATRQVTTLETELLGLRGEARLAEGRVRDGEDRLGAARAALADAARRLRAAAAPPE